MNWWWWWKGCKSCTGRTTALEVNLTTAEGPTCQQQDYGKSLPKINTRLIDMENMKNYNKCTGKNSGEGRVGTKGARINVLNRVVRK